MTERHFNIREIDETTISEALGAESQTARDVAHGAGQAIAMADGNAVLEVFPDASVARVTTQDARVELFRVPGFSVDKDLGRVVFEQGQDDTKMRLIVGASGHVHLYPLKKPTEPLVHQGSASSTPEGQSTRTEEAQAATDTTQPVDQDAGKEQEPVTLRGRLGRDPWFSGGADSPLAGFPLAINGENKTTWHKVVVSDETALALKELAQRGDVQKGRLVDVTGQTVTREEETDKGIKKIVEFQATQVSRVRATAKRPDARP
jgi:Single-strand binding protein family